MAAVEDEVLEIFDANSTHSITYKYITPYVFCAAFNDNQLKHSILKSIMTTKMKHRVSSYCMATCCCS